MKPVEYVFRIDAFTPETLPMARLAEYLAALSKLFGYPEHTHFRAVTPGSARLVAVIDPVDAPKVETRLNGIRIGEAPKDALAAKHSLEELLANDNALGSLTELESGREVVPFVGRNRPKRISFPPFREDTSIDGQLVSVGGRDSTAHAILQDGDLIHAGLSMSRELARQLAPLLYGPPIRLHGNGRFERQSSGEWRMTDFRVDRAKQLDGRPITEVLESLRIIPGNDLMSPGAVASIADLRSDDVDGAK